MRLEPIEASSFFIGDEGADKGFVIILGLGRVSTLELRSSQSFKAP